MLLCARLELDPEQEAALVAVCQGIDDWSQVIGHADYHLMLPLVYHHLRRLSAQAGVPDAVLAEIHASCRMQGLRSLDFTADQRSLIQDVLEPLSVPHMFFKGQTLAAHYYGAIVRPCRDIDVLVPRASLVDVAMQAQERGFTVDGPTPLSRQDMEAAARYRPVLCLRGPRGAPIEVHHRLDKSGWIYDSGQLLRSARLIQVQGQALPVMPAADLFVYLCLHHTRHRWARLHWLADLDALMRHPEFDLDAVLTRAAQLGVTSTVRTSINLQQLLSRPGPWDETGLDHPTRSLARVALACMDGGSSAELASLHEVRGYLRDFAFEWQTNWKQRLLDRLASWAACFRPNFADYQQWPLPSRWHWLYVFLRPFTGLNRNLRRRWKR
ncbi:MAG: nucleotidyltransferase family protein [Xanthomonadales bacterium]|nr:nucleotidyltransferase family protein [Xanthomonadales bacterium]